VLRPIAAIAGGLPGKARPFTPGGERRGQSAHAVFENGAGSGGMRGGEEWRTNTSLSQEHVTAVRLASQPARTDRSLTGVRSRRHQMIEAETDRPDRRARRARGTILSPLKVAMWLRGSRLEAFDHAHDRQTL
jgi:hypothetical protein